MDFIREIFNAQASQALIGIKHVYKQTILMIKNCWRTKLLVSLAGTCGEAKWIVEANALQPMTVDSPVFAEYTDVNLSLCVKTC